MDRTRIIIAGIVLLIIVIIGGVWLYNWVLGPTEAATGPVTAIPIELTGSPQVEGTGSVEPTSIPATVLPPTQEQVQTPTAEPVAPIATPEAVSNLRIYGIVQDSSEVRFNIFEELGGQPNDVIGVSNQVAGEAAVDLSDLSTAQVGVITVNARTLVTDEDRRNQAIRNRILQTDQYEFITFTPTGVSGLSGSGEPGQTYTFQVAGDLTIRDITQEVVFDVTAQVTSEGRLEGTATTIVNRADYNLVIPSVPGVANVGEEVTLEIDFAMAAVP